MRPRSKWASHKTGKVLGGVSLALLLGTRLSWAGPPNPTQSDSMGNIAGVAMRSLPTPATIIRPLAWAHIAGRILPSCSCFVHTI
jgi:hypothetical protein